MLIQLTPDHVARGQPGTCRSCPVALALCDALPHCGVTVGREYARLWLLDDGRSVAVGLPFDVGEAIARYDRTGEMDAFDFVLDVEAHPWLTPPATC